jgi:predicted HicB family RNase H-like nuclease
MRNGDVIPKPARQMSGKLTLRMPRSLHESVAEAAERDGVSINQWIVTKLANSL